MLIAKAPAQVRTAGGVTDRKGVDDPMIVTGAILADYARVSEGKLDVLGGVLSHLIRPKDSGVGANLIIFTQADDGDNAEVSASVRGPDGVEFSFTLPVPDETRAGVDVGFFLTQIGVPPEAPDGRYVLLVGDTVSLPFWVQTR